MAASRATRDRRRPRSVPRLLRVERLRPAPRRGRPAERAAAARAPAAFAGLCPAPGSRALSGGRPIGARLARPKVRR
ncbi:hypothetical protein SCE1572_24310 [Sorangium cellulosum So0157-2]|uniref:Uncharacterized protein n=1 Tax=Sorangium cellulosum So0157-2 TaxID=1254432 RepID=S4Y376_SORCE|nr:hypothetical protein SCE1572_24310 [Sorangium cellulosum So0157-2]